jgi:[acyl-carrier-protein] S-malonyltransferase
VKNLAFLFPGQGAQYPGMGKDFFDTFLVAREVFEEADDVLSFHLSRVIFEGSPEQLIETRYSQAAIFVASVAILRVLQQQMPQLDCSVCSGLSLGEYSALFASRRILFSDCLRLVQLRGRLLNEACEIVKGTMAAVLGLNAGEVLECIENLSDVWVANYNCPGQTVISGTQQGVETATLLLRSKGARRVVPLQVQGAFHSPLMQRAQDQLMPAIKQVELFDSTTEFVMNVPGDFVCDSSEIRENLIRQVTHSVCWEQGIRAMMRRDVVMYIEIGCSKTLTGMNKKIDTIRPTVSIEKVSELETVASLAGVQ